MRPEYIARISHGKDSLKMLDVIITRGLPLDRITTTDVWATDTIRGELPEMLAFKDFADEYIWRKYRIEVEHLCAMRNGKKVTYESMFYHIPNRKEYSGGGESWTGKIKGWPMQKKSWCQKLKHASAKAPGHNPRIPDFLGSLVSVGSQAECKDGHINRVHGVRGSNTVFRKPHHEGQEKKYRGVSGHSSGRAGPFQPTQ